MDGWLTASRREWRPEERLFPQQRHEQSFIYEPLKHAPRRARHSIKALKGCLGCLGCCCCCCCCPLLSSSELSISLPPSPSPFCFSFIALPLRSVRHLTHNCWNCILHARSPPASGRSHYRLKIKPAPPVKTAASIHLHRISAAFPTDIYPPPVRAACAAVVRCTRPTPSNW